MKPFKQFITEEEFTTIDDGVWTDYKQDSQFYVSYKIKNWFQQALNFHVNTNSKYSNDIDGVPTYDVAPVNYPKDYYIISYPKLKDFLFYPTYERVGDKNIPRKHFHSFPIEVRVKLNQLLNKVGWTELKVDLYDK